MSHRLEKYSYGKSRVRLLKVHRDGDVHRIRELTVAIELEGDFAASYSDGDNSAVIATDSMKNTVYVLAKDHPIETIESFAIDLARHFVTTYPQVAEAKTEVVETGWSRIPLDGAPHPHSFVRSGGEAPNASASVSAGGERVESGIGRLIVLKTTDSAFVGFVRDRFTTLPEATDRVFSTEVTARWQLPVSGSDFAKVRESSRTAILETFAAHESDSVQQTLAAMAEEILERCPEVTRVDLELPNLHYIPFDLTPFGLENNLEIFVPSAEPFGVIRGTVVRGS